MTPLNQYTQELLKDLRRTRLHCHLLTLGSMGILFAASFIYGTGSRSTTSFWLTVLSGGIALSVIWGNVRSLRKLRAVERSLRASAARASQGSDHFDSIEL